MEKTWTFPKEGFVKVNVHALTLDAALPNGNGSGIGIVIRDRSGKILKMVSGSIQNLTERGNELWSLLAGLRSAYYEKENNVILETDNLEGLKEWEDWRWFLDPNHARVIQQLEQRKKDPNLRLDVSPIEASQNNLARYLAEDGALNRTRLVIFRRSFGRVKEIWKHDMGLGAVGEEFAEISEEDYVNGHAHEEDIVDMMDDEDDEGERLVEDAALVGMGQKHDRMASLMIISFYSLCSDVFYFNVYVDLTLICVNQKSSLQPFAKWSINLVQACYPFDN